MPLHDNRVRKEKEGTVINNYQWTAVCGVPEITKRRSCTPQVLRDKRRRISRVAGHHDGSTYSTK
ncbi:hypothetical protein pdam_00017749 [Pocillopora damicornis]|uniref:Uncharacterized protein n=1 Tax=Pocillopora damicornis TaxID=46731 RepID=A0A3M6TJ43_POCDA|nr:hypothetical protein pdam_00017749 [Pocillopora damicornis]